MDLVKSVQVQHLGPTCFPLKLGEQKNVYLQDAYRVTCRANRETTYVHWQR